MAPLDTTSLVGRINVVAKHLYRRADDAAKTKTWNKCPGCTNPASVNNKFFFAFFAILFVGLVLGGIWFFGFARNGGFHYEQGDWEDYKTVVLRRKGPDGKSLPSSKSTRYGEGTVWGEERDAKLERLRWAAMSVVARDDKGRLGILAKRGPLGTHSCTYRDDFTNFGGTKKEKARGAGRKAEMSEVGSLPDWSRVVPSAHRDKKSHKQHNRGGYEEIRPVPGAFDVDLEAGKRNSGQQQHHGKRYKDRDVTAYARERVARVGGMNRAADGSGVLDFSGSEVSGASASSMRPLDPKHERAERRAASEAERMERQWRREARRAAENLAREHAGPVGGSAGSSRNASPVKRTAATPSGGVGVRRGGSPTKRTGREYSFSRPEGYGSDQGGAAKGASYLDAYRPRR